MSCEKCKYKILFIGHNYAGNSFVYFSNTPLHRCTLKFTSDPNLTLHTKRPHSVKYFVPLWNNLPNRVRTKWKYWKPINEINWSLRFFFCLMVNNDKIQVPSAKYDLQSSNTCQHKKKYDLHSSNTCQHKKMRSYAITYTSIMR